VFGLNVPDLNQWLELTTNRIEASRIFCMYKLISLVNALLDYYKMTGTWNQNIIVDYWIYLQILCGRVHSRWVIVHILWNGETFSWYALVTKVWALTAGKKCRFCAGQVVIGQHTIYQGIQLTYGIFFSVLHFQFSWLFVSALSLPVTIFFFVKLNRDTWANDAVSQTISTNFIFWQVSLLFCSYICGQFIFVVLTSLGMGSWYAVL
jgi:hypothetical protein